jgi:hypothetical protein
MASLIVQDPEDAYMEDVYVAELTSKASKKSTTTVVVDEDHPFDLEAYLANYERERLPFQTSFRSSVMSNICFS